MQVGGPIIPTGASVWSADGRRLGTVTRADEHGFAVGQCALLLGAEAALGYADVDRVESDIVVLDISSETVVDRHRNSPSRSPAPVVEACSGEDARDAVVSIHAELREVMRRVLALARGARTRDERARGALGEALRELAGLVRVHVTLERRAVEPIVAAFDAWGDVRLERLHVVHADEVATTRESLSPGLFDDEVERMIAAARRAVKAIARDLRREERDVLSVVLDDDLVVADQLTD